jgi:hypothetical protein
LLIRSDFTIIGDEDAFGAFGVFGVFEEVFLTLGMAVVALGASGCAVSAVLVVSLSSVLLGFFALGGLIDPKPLLIEAPILAA